MMRTDVIPVSGTRAVTVTYDVTPDPGTVVRDLGDGVTVVERAAPSTPGAAWVAPFTVNCAGHGRIESRQTADAAASDGYAHLARVHGVSGPGWDEPAGCSSPRGWLHRGGTVTGFYLDYGPETYRHGPRYCEARRPCRECQPGTVLAVRYPAGPGTRTESRYCETVPDARRFVVAGD